MNAFRSFKNFLTYYEIYLMAVALKRFSRRGNPHAISGLMKIRADFMNSFTNVNIDGSDYSFRQLREVMEEEGNYFDKLTSKYLDKLFDIFY